MPNDPIQAMEFAQSKGQARKDGRTGVLFADVAGCDDALRKLGYVVEARRPLMRCRICLFHCAEVGTLQDVSFGGTKRNCKTASG